MTKTMDPIKYIDEASSVRVRCIDGTLIFDKKDMELFIDDKFITPIEVTKAEFLNCLCGKPSTRDGVDTCIKLDIKCVWPNFLLETWDIYYNVDPASFCEMITRPSYNYTLKNVPAEVLIKAFNASYDLLEIYKAYLNTRSKELVKHMMTTLKVCDLKGLARVVLKNANWQLDTKEEINFIVFTLVIPYL